MRSKAYAPMLRCLTALPCVAALATATPALAQDRPSAPDARVYFINLKDGDTVTSPFLVQFGLSGMGIAPANFENEWTKNTGHHHLLINREIKPEDLTAATPADANNIHYGRGQTEATITLPPGRHTLQLLFADWTHVPHTPPVMSQRITITVR